MENNYLNRKDNHAQLMHEFDIMLRQEFGMDIIDFIELEEDTVDAFALLADLADGKEVEEQSTSFEELDPGGSIPMCWPW